MENLTSSMIERFKSQLSDDLAVPTSRLTSRYWVYDLFVRVTLGVEILLNLGIIRKYPSSTHAQGTQDGNGKYRCNICYLGGLSVYYHSKKRYLNHLERHNTGKTLTNFFVVRPTWLFDQLFCCLTNFYRKALSWLVHWSTLLSQIDGCLIRTHFQSLLFTQARCSKRKFAAILWRLSNDRCSWSSTTFSWAPIAA